MNLATLPTELIELLCSLAAEVAIEESELRESIARTYADLRDPANELKSFSLSSLPLIHPRWTIAGTKALYRNIYLDTADQYKAFQNSLTSYPDNGNHVRRLSIRWYKGDYGGPDGYAYKVLGWFHQMEIQNVIRMCPRLEYFDPGRDSPVVSQEGIAALGTLSELRLVAWRNVDFQTNAKTVIEIISRWRQPETLRLYSLDKKAVKMMHPIFNQISTLTVHDHNLALDLTLLSLKNLRHLDLAYTAQSRPQKNHLLQIISKYGTNLTHLTIRDDNTPIWFVSKILLLAPRIQFLYIAISREGFLGQFGGLGKGEDGMWRSDTLVEILFQWSYINDFPVEWRYKVLGSQMRAENLPQLKKITEIFSMEEGMPVIVDGPLWEYWNLVKFGSKFHNVSSS
jgi:hypothetical protein